jgi:hypothetical protein
MPLRHLNQAISMSSESVKLKGEVSQFHWPHVW